MAPRKAKNDKGKKKKSDENPTEEAAAASDQAASPLKTESESAGVIDVTPPPSLDGTTRDEFDALLASLDPAYHQIVIDIIKHPIRQFQKGTIDDFLKTIEQKGLPEAMAEALDSRDYASGNSWEVAHMNIMNSIVPPDKQMVALLRQGIADGSTLAVKWLPEVTGDPKELKEALTPALKGGTPERRFWAAVHLSRQAPDAEELTAVLVEGLNSDWVAYKKSYSTTGLTGRGESARALARLGSKAEAARGDLTEQLSAEEVDSADAAEMAGALYQISSDISMVMEKVAAIAERILVQRRGHELHAGDRELMQTLRNLIPKWKEAGDKDNDALAEKVELLEKEISYHLGAH